MIKKFLFLDIDGVLNHEEWYRTRFSKMSKIEYPLSEFDPECVRRVNEILERTGAKLVISSSWRLDGGLWKVFEKVGLPIDFDITTSKYNGGLNRGSEIKSYLEDINGPYTYCIVDDDNDMLKSQRKNFVKTSADPCTDLCEKNGGTGLTEKCKEKIIKILNNGTDKS